MSEIEKKLLDMYFFTDDYEVFINTYKKLYTTLFSTDSALEEWHIFWFIKGNVEKQYISCGPVEYLDMLQSISIMVPLKMP